MKRFASRLAQSALTIVAVVTLSFGMIRLIPGGPLAYLRAQYAETGRDPGNLDNLAEEYFNTQFDAPLWQQYIDYVVNLIHGDLGRSLFLRESVSHLMAEGLPWTILVMSIGILFTYAIGILLGAAMAYRERSTFDSVGTVLSIISNSIPYYVVGLLFLYIFGYQMGLFPTSGTNDVDPGLTLSFFIDALYHATLPAVALILTATGGTAIIMRGNSVSTLGEDYLRVARLRGLSTNRISTRYVVWNSVLPMYTNLMISIGFMFGGSIILEQIFQYEGIGYYMYQGITSRDYPLMMGAFLIITVTVTIAILVADLTYGFIDPRASSPDEAHASISLQSITNNIRRRMKSIISSGEESARGSSGPQPSKKIESQLSFESTGEEQAYSSFRDLVSEAKAMGRTLWEDPRAKVGIVILCFYFVAGTIGIWIIPEPVTGQGPSRLQPFQNMDFILGTNPQGQSMLGLLVYSIPPMFEMILAGAVVATIVATAVGTIAGYVGGIVDRILTTAADIMIALPGLPLLIVIAAIFQPRSPYAIGLILSVNIWAGLARNIRSQVLTLRDISYVESSRTIGVPVRSIISRDILPNIMSYVTVNFAYNARSIIFSSVALYFLGVLPYSIYNWGVIMNNAYENGALYTSELAYWLVFPMLTIVILTLGMMLLAQGLDRIFNPRIRSRHMDDEMDSSDNQSVTTPPSASD